MEEIPITLTKKERDLVLSSLNTLDRQLVDLCIKGNAGKCEWNRVYDIESVVRSIQYGITQAQLDSENNV